MEANNYNTINKPDVMVRDSKWISSVTDISVPPYKNVLKKDAGKISNYKGLQIQARIVHVS
jgi:hypothetical protein